MFKGFGKRRASVAQLDRDRDEAGKENGPVGGAMTKATKRTSVFHDNDRNKTVHLNTASKAKAIVQQNSGGQDSVEMTHAFDELLVSLRSLSSSF
jgi:hypothetical protein